MNLNCIKLLQQNFLLSSQKHSFLHTARAFWNLHIIFESGSCGILLNIDGLKLSKIFKFIYRPVNVKFCCIFYLIPNRQIFVALLFNFDLILFAFFVSIAWYLIIRNNFVPFCFSIIFRTIAISCRAEIFYDKEYSKTCLNNFFFAFLFFSHIHPSLFCVRATIFFCRTSVEK